MSKLKARKDVKTAFVPQIVGSGGVGSVDFHIPVIDFLENNGEIPLNFKDYILNSPDRLFGNDGEDWATSVRANRDLFFKRQSDFLLGRMWSRYPSDVSSWDWEPGIGAISWMDQSKHKYKGGLPTFPAPLASVMRENYPFYDKIFSKATLRVFPSISELTRNMARFEYGGMSNLHFPEYEDKEMVFPNINTSKFQYDIWSLGSYGVTSDGSIIAHVGNDTESSFSSYRSTLTPGLYKFNLSTGEIDTNFYIKNANGSRGVFASEWTISFNLIVANDCVFLDTNSGYTINFDDGTSIEPGRLIKLGLDGTIDLSFFTTELLCGSLVNVHFRNNKYILAFQSLYYYSGLFEQSEKEVGLLQVDIDGTNPVILFERQINDFSQPLITGTVMKTKMLSNGDIILSVFNYDDYFGNDGVIYKVLNDGSIDYGFTFMNFSEVDGPSTYKYSFKPANGMPGFSCIKGFEELGNGEIIIYGLFRYINLGTSNDLNQHESSNVVVGNLLKIDSTGDIEFGFNNLGTKFNSGKPYNISFFNSSSAEWMNCEVYLIKKIGNKLYVSFGNDGAYQKPFYENYGSEAYNPFLIRLNLDGSFDESFNLNITDASKGIEEFNGKLYIISEYSSQIDYLLYKRSGALKVTDGIPTIKKTRVDFNWIDVDGEPLQTSFTKKTITEIDLANPNILSVSLTGQLRSDLESDTLLYSVKGYDWYSVSSDFLTTSWQVLNGQTYDGQDFSQNIGFKYFNGEELNSEELLQIEEIKAGIVRLYSKPEYYPDLSYDKIPANPVTGFQGWNPFGISNQLTDTNFEEGMDLSWDYCLDDIFPFEQFNMLSYSDRTYKINRIQGSMGDIIRDYESGNWYVWNHFLNKFDSILGYKYEDIQTTIRSNFDSKLRAVIELGLSSRPYTWANYHIIKTHLDNYIESIQY